MIIYSICFHYTNRKQHDDCMEPGAPLRLSQQGIEQILIILRWYVEVLKDKNLVIDTSRFKGGHMPRP